MTRKKKTPWWLWLFSTIGLYATVVKLLQLFAGLGRASISPKADSFPEPGSDTFLQALSHTLDTPIRHGGEAEILNNGDAFFPALLGDIDSARHSIHLMTYIWRPGKISDLIFERLIERAREGVEVRLMIDGIGSFVAPTKQVKALREAGGKVAVFSPLPSSHFLHLSRRNHRRAFIIDGRVGYTGGMSIADQWLGDAEGPEYWRDTMLRATGPLAHSIQVAFIQLWVNVTGEQLVGSRYFAPVDETPATTPRHLGIVHSPAGPVQPLLHCFWFSLKAARESIYIANAYFAPSRTIRQVLTAKARAGLDVRILLPGRHTDNPFVRWASHRWYEEFLDAGIRLYEYTPTMMHAKHLVIDGHWTIIGSANIDARSIQLNQENVVGIASEALGSELLETFQKDFSRSCEITRETWRERPWWQRARERSLVVFKAQL